VKLPNAENAIVDIAKLRDYCLNPNHFEGKHKARVFLKALGIDKNDAEQLRQIILQAILRADAMEQKPTEFGRRFVVDLQVSWAKESVIRIAHMRTAWMIRTDENVPRLTTCFILERSIYHG
jgi:hypothetical protein